MAKWPSALTGNPLRGTWSEQREKSFTEFQPEVGPPKRRRRSTVTNKLVQGAYRMTDAQMEEWWLWYENVIADGTLPFEFPHPTTDVLMNCLLDSASDTEFSPGYRRLDVAMRCIP